MNCINNPPQWHALAPFRGTNTALLFSLCGSEKKLHSFVAPSDARPAEGNSLTLSHLYAAATQLRASLMRPTRNCCI